MLGAGGADDHRRCTGGWRVFKSAQRLTPPITDAGVDEQVERVDVPAGVLRRFAKAAGVPLAQLVDE